jgi:hypothetical protein
MRLTTLVAGTVAGVAGLAGATAGYVQLSASPRHSETVRVADAPPAAPARTSRPEPVTKVRLRDCPRGFRLRGKACVREVERTVVIHVAPPAAAPARAAAPAAVPPPAEPQPAGVPGTHDAGDDQGGRGDQAGVRHDGPEGDGARGDDGEHATEDHGDDHATEDHGDDGDHATEDHGDDTEPAEVEDHPDEVEAG